MEYSRKTKLGRVEWNPGTLAGVLANERHCGDVSMGILTGKIAPEAGKD